jgi:hypothetical protein
MKISKKKLQTMIKEAVREGCARRSPVEEQGLSETDNEEGGEEMPYDRHEHGYRRSTSWGEIPSSEELWELMDGDDFEMELKGTDSLAWEYATLLSDEPMAGSTAAGEGMHASLEALVNAPHPGELSDEQYEEVVHILDTWAERYGGEYPHETAWNLASSIMDVLGVEWI